MARLTVFFLGWLCLTSIACSPSPERKQQSKVLFLAAASTTGAVTDIAELYKRETEVEVTVSTGPSNALAQQILSGAPADVFLSANPKWADAVSEEGLAADRRDVLGNSLVIVVPKGNPAAVKSPEDLTGEEVKHVALAGEKVPAGIYAEEALRSAKIYEKLIEQSKIVRGHDVRITLGYIEAGETQAGVVYATDALSSGKVEVVYCFPEGSHSPITYPLVLIKQSDNSEEAKRFFEFLQSTKALNVFSDHGFRVQARQGGETT